MYLKMEMQWSNLVFTVNYMAYQKMGVCELWWMIHSPVFTVYSGVQKFELRLQSFKKAECANF